MKRKGPSLLLAIALSLILIYFLISLGSILFPFSAENWLGCGVLLVIVIALAAVIALLLHSLFKPTIFIDHQARA